ncbi:MAG: ABC transporter permease [Candidatus Aegiribacteria sp.]
MRTAPRRSSLIAAIVRKDLLEFSRDRLWMLLTPLSLIIVILVFLLLPGEVEQRVVLGVYPERMASLLSTAAGDLGPTGFEVTGFPSPEGLAEAAGSDSDGEISAGLAFPSDFPEGLAAGRSEEIMVYLPASVPPEFRRAVESGVREMGYAFRAVLRGEDPLKALPVELPDAMSLLGESADYDGPIPAKQRMRPLLVIMIFLVEALALAGLVSTEVEHRTASAILVTPAACGDFLAAKCITGILLAAAQAFLFLLATGAFSFDWPLVSTLMILGAVMASAVGMLAGTGGRDFMGTMFFGILLIVPLMIPAFSALIPGRPALVVRLLPSYGLVQAMTGVLGGGAGWGHAAPHLVSTLAWDAVLLAAALLLLRRKVRSL